MHDVPETGIRLKIRSGLGLIKHDKWVGGASSGRKFHVIQSLKSSHLTFPFQGAGVEEKRGGAETPSESDRR